MKILLVSVRSQKSKGGIAVWTEHFIKKCEKSNIDYFLVNTEIVGKRQTDDAAKRNLFDEFIRTKRIFNDLKKFFNETFDIAHVNTSCGTFGLIRDYLIVKKIKKQGIKTVVHYHCDIPYWVKNKISKYFLFKLASLSDVNMVLCDNSVKFLKDNYNLKSVKVPNFVDDTIIIEKKETNKNIDNICFVGSIVKSKGILEIFQLAQRFPKYTFNLIGVVSEEIQAVKKPDNVYLRGAFDNKKIINCLDDADIFLFPSYSEGFSMALAESMARGVPVIATDVGANKDMIEDKGGCIVKVGDVDEMQKALEKLSDKKIRQEMSEWLIDKVKNNYTLDSVFKKILDCYQI